jgi:EpsI family protein
MSNLLPMKTRKNATRFWLLLATLLVCGALINVWQHAGEAMMSRQSLKAFPAQLGEWRQQGSDQILDDETLRVLRADDYLSRNFEANGRVASFYVGYYATQRTGATYHSPLNCLPGAGWTLTEGPRVTIAPANGGPAFEANRYLIQNGGDRELMIYWYLGRGRATASEYWGKVYTVVDSVRRRRSDGAIVRVMVPVGDSEDTALNAATELAAQAASQLPPFVPN